MEQKHLLMAALGLGIGAGLGLGLASGQTLSKWSSLGTASSSNGITAEIMEQELMWMIIGGKDANVTFDNFPYYISEQTRVLLTSAACFHLKNGDFAKHTQNLLPASRAILLSAPTELYQQTLAKALAHLFDAKLLLLDATDFVLKIQGKHGVNKDSSLKRSRSKTTLYHLSRLFGSFSLLPAKKEAQASHKHISNWSFDEQLLIQSLYKVLVAVSKSHPIVLYIRDVDMLLFRSQRLHKLFKKMSKKLSGPILILGSRMTNPDSKDSKIDERLVDLFPYNIEIKPPEDQVHLVRWKSQLKEDTKKIQCQDNRNHIIEVLAANDVECNDLDSICVEDTLILSKYIEEIVVSAISHHLMNNKHEYRNGKLLISSQSLSHGLGVFQGGNSVRNKDSETSKKLPPDNGFEKWIRSAVIPAGEISVTFAHVGALEEIKESLQELVMLPLRRPDLFKGELLKPCRGILLFGPPGTGKTMLAKAIAKEAGASFINVCISTIISKWFGDTEKYVKALFTLAAKVSPTVIFVDEVDSMLGQRTRAGEHEAMRRLKNEFMTHWDGLITKPGKQILVLAATNRPFDLDEAVIRRFERRIMVGLPTVEHRENILRTLLAKENVEGLDLKEIARMTEGYTGSDLKNLCTTAAYRPVRELIEKERLKDMEREHKSKQGKSTDGASSSKKVNEERKISLRPLNLEDFRQVKDQVAASFVAGGENMNELKQWNDLYGEGGSRKQPQLTYFL